MNVVIMGVLWCLRTLIQENEMQPFAKNIVVCK